MLDNLYKKTYSLSNLKLAWIRLNTAQNIYYKNYYRNLFLAYELRSLENLKKLSERLKGQSYEPSDILRFYLPKHSGLHRPITFLHLDDLIVYQAFSNIIAEKFWEQRLEIQFVNAFSHAFNESDKKSIYLFKRWQDCYKQFRNKITEYFNEGSTWVAHFDLAAYYDTIDLNLLSNQISREAYKDFTDFVKNCISKWTTHKTSKLGHGIPQGPISSALIGEIYLLPVDKKLKKKNIKYVRYVDDIKIFGKSKQEVQEAIITLELECKERGIIPQSKKYEIKKAENIEEAIGKFPSLQSEEKKVILGNKKEVYEIFIRSFDPNNFDVSRVRYILKTIGKNDLILENIIPNLKEYPELVDEFCRFLINYSYSKDIAEEIYEKALRKPSVYPYVEGRYWSLISAFNINNHSLKRKLLRRARDRIKRNHDKYSLKLGCYRLLCSVDSSEIFKWLSHESSCLTQMMVMHYIETNDGIALKDFIKDVLFKRTNYDASLSAIKELIFIGKEDLLQDIKAPVQDKSGVIANTLGSPINIDPIHQILSNTYVTNFRKWKKFLGQKHEQVNHLVFLAYKSFHIDKNAWVNYTDSFMDVVFREFINLLKCKSVNINLPKTINVRGELIDYGRLLNNENLKNNYSDIVNGLKKIHIRRREAPTSHAFDKKTLRKTQRVRSPEQKNLVAILNNALNKLTDEVNKYL